MKIYFEDIIGASIIMYNKLLKRRSVSQKEINAIKKNISMKYSKDNIFFAGIECADFLEDIVDEVRTEEDLFYKLKPNVTIEELRRKVISPLSVKKAIILVDKEVYSKTLLYSLEDERVMPEFQKIDESVQLELIKKLFLLEKEKRKLSKKLEITRRNSKVLVDINTINEFLDNPKISYRQTLEEFYQEEQPKTIKSK